MIIISGFAIQVQQHPNESAISWWHGRYCHSAQNLPLLFMALIQNSSFIDLSQNTLDNKSIKSKLRSTGHSLQFKSSKNIQRDPNVCSLVKRASIFLHLLKDHFIFYYKLYYQPNNLCGSFLNFKYSIS